MSKFMSFLMGAKKKDAKRRADASSPDQARAPVRRPGGSSGVAKTAAEVREARLLHFDEVWSSVWTVLRENRRTFVSHQRHQHRAEQQQQQQQRRSTDDLIAFVASGLSELCAVLHREARETPPGEAPPCYELLLRRDVVRCACEYADPAGDPDLIASRVFPHVLCFVSDVLVFAGGSEEMPLVGQHRQIVAPVRALLSNLRALLSRCAASSLALSPRRRRGGDGGGGGSGARAPPARKKAPDTVYYSFLYLLYGLAFQLQAFPRCLQFFVDEDLAAAPPPAAGAAADGDVAAAEVVLVADWALEYIGLDDFVEAEEFFLFLEQQRRGAANAARYQALMHGGGGGGSGGRRTRPIHDRISGKRLHLSDLAVDVVACVATAADEAARCYFDGRAAVVADLLLHEVLRLRRQLGTAAGGGGDGRSVPVVDAGEATVLLDRLSVAVRAVDSVVSTSPSRLLAAALLEGLCEEALGQGREEEEEEEGGEGGSSFFLDVSTAAGCRFCVFFLSLLRADGDVMREVLAFLCRVRVQATLVRAVRGGDGDPRCAAALTLLCALLDAGAAGGWGDAVDASRFARTAAAVVEEEEAAAAAAAGGGGGDDGVSAAASPSAPPPAAPELLLVDRFPLSFHLLWQNGLLLRSAAAAAEGAGSGGGGGGSRSSTHHLARLRLPLLTARGGSVAPRTPVGDRLFLEDGEGSDGGSDSAAAAATFDAHAHAPMYMVPVDDAAPDDGDASAAPAAGRGEVLWAHVLAHAGGSEAAAEALLARPTLCGALYTMMLGERAPEAPHSALLLNVDAFFHEEPMWRLGEMDAVWAAAVRDAGPRAAAARGGLAFVASEALLGACGALVRQSHDAAGALRACVSLLTQAVAAGGARAVAALFAPDAAVLAALSGVKRDVAAAVGVHGREGFAAHLRRARGELGILRGVGAAGSALAAGVMPALPAAQRRQFEAWAVLEEWRVELNATLSALRQVEVVEAMALMV